MQVSLKTVGIVFSIGFALTITLWFGVAEANPDQFLENSMGSAVNVASSSPAFMTPGTATSTNSFDTQSDGALPAKSAVLFVALTGSTSATIANIAIEYSQNNNDWYQDFISGAATTSNNIAFGNPVKFTLNGATSSQAVIGNQKTVTNTVYRAFEVNVPSRYVRAVITLASSTVITAANANGSVWSNFIAKKETR